MTLLRLSMALYGVLALASGLLAMLFPGPLAGLGETQSNTFLLGSWGWLTALIGLGVLLASRDPIRHILWLRLALASFLVGGVYDLFHYLIGTVSLGAIALDLAAYLLFGGLFTALLSAEIKPARALSLTLLSGALGNLLNALLADPSHASLGASTAVFGALGLLVATRRSTTTPQNS